MRKTYARIMMLFPLFVICCTNAFSQYDACFLQYNSCVESTASCSNSCYEETAYFSYNGTSVLCNYDALFSLCRSANQLQPPTLKQGSFSTNTLLYYLSTGTEEPAGINSFCAAWSNAALNECSNYNRTVCLPDCYATPDSCLDQLNACINQASGGGGGSGTPPSLTSIEFTKANLGPTCDEDACVPKPINLATGNMYFQHADYRAAGLSENLSVIRSYNSQSNFSGLFGMGWSTDYDISLTVESDLRVSVMFNDGSSLYYYRPSSSTSTFAAYAPPTDKSNVILNVGANTYTLVLKSNGKYVFNSNGKLISIIDPNGNTTSLAYDGSNRLLTVTSPTGRTLNFAYNASGKVAAISDGAAGTVDPSYNPATLGTIATYEYDPASGSLLIRATYSGGSQYRCGFRRSWPSIPESCWPPPGAKRRWVALIFTYMANFRQ